MSPRRRLLGAIEAANGMLMFAVGGQLLRNIPEFHRLKADLNR